MEFVDTATNRALRFSIGRESSSGRHYLAIPVSNALTDYEEYYEIPAALHDGHPGNTPELAEFAARCRQRRNDHLLFLAPGKDRGVG